MSVLEEEAVPGGSKVRRRLSVPAPECGYLGRMSVLEVCWEALSQRGTGVLAPRKLLRVSQALLFSSDFS